MQDTQYIAQNQDNLLRQTKREFRNIFDKSNQWAAKEEEQTHQDMTQDSQMNEDELSHNFIHDETMSYQPLQSDVSQAPSFYPQSQLSIAPTQSMTSSEHTNLNLNAKSFLPKQFLGKRKHMNDISEQDNEFAAPIFKVTHHPGIHDLPLKEKQESLANFTDFASTCIDESTGQYPAQSSLSRCDSMSINIVKTRTQMEDTFAENEQSYKTTITLVETKAQKQDKINEFRLKRKAAEQSGRHYDQSVKDIH